MKTIIYCMPQGHQESFSKKIFYIPYVIMYSNEEIFIRWFFDGNLVHQLDVSSLGAKSNQWPNEEMYIVLNNGQKTSSPDDNTVWPNHLRVDYIRLYQRA